MPSPLSLLKHLGLFLSSLAVSLLAGPCQALTSYCSKIGSQLLVQADLDPFLLEALQEIGRLRERRWPTANYSWSLRFEAVAFVEPLVGVGLARKSQSLCALVTSAV